MSRKSSTLLGKRPFRVTAGAGVVGVQEMPQGYTGGVVRASTVTDDRMNGTEAKYARGVLEAARLDGSIVEWRFEPLVLILGHGTACRYKPDFLVVTRDRLLEFHETKGGYIREDAEVKFKMAAELYPWFIFRMLQLEGGKTWREVRTLNAPTMS